MSEEPRYGLFQSGPPPKPYEPGWYDKGGIVPVAHDAASYGAPMHMPMGLDCAVHKHRTWTPIERHHVQPLGMGGPNVEANIIRVCIAGHYEIHEVIRRLIANNGRIPDSRHFGAKVKKYALQGWQEAGKPTHGGGGE